MLSSRFASALTGLAVAVLLAAAAGPGPSAGAAEKPVKAFISSRPVPLESIAYERIPGWMADDHAAALDAFLVSCRKLGRPPEPDDPPVLPDKAWIVTELVRICDVAEAMPESERSNREAARQFFERWFDPFNVRGPRAGRLTGYYEPEVDGSLERSAEYDVPVFRRPPDLVSLVDGGGAVPPGGWTAMRNDNGKLVPYFTRAEIDDGALDDKGLELLYLASPVDAFFMHIQGSGRVRLPDGRVMRIGFDGKNGYPFTPIARVMLKRGLVRKEDLALARMKAWLAADPERGRKIMQENKSYIFFKERKELSPEMGPVGGQDVPLTPGRSLAVDPAYNPLGLPIFVVSPGMKHAGKRGFRRLMIAQDIGSAIKGPERGDVFWGSGDAAGRSAGRTNHPGHFVVLLPRTSPR